MQNYIQDDAEINIYFPNLPISEGKDGAYSTENNQQFSLKMLELVKQDLMLSMKGALQEKKKMILVTEKTEALKVEREMILLKETMEKMTTRGKKSLTKMM